MHPPQFSVEIFGLFIEEMDEPTQIACMKVSHMFWRLARPFVFARVSFVLRYGTPRSLERLNTLLECMKHPHDPILSLIEMFEVKFFSPPVLPEVNYYPPPEMGKSLAEAIHLLKRAPKLESVTVGVSDSDEVGDFGSGSLTWDSVSWIIQDSLQELVRLSQLNELSILYLNGIPADMFQHFRGSVLEIHECDVGGRWQHWVDRQLPTLDLSEIYNRSDFPFFDIYKEIDSPLEDGSIKAPYSRLTTVWTDLTLQSWRRLSKTLGYAHASLKSLLLFFTDELFTFDESYQIDLAAFGNLQEFRLDYQRPTELITMEHKPDDVTPLCDAFLRPSSSMKSLETLAISISISYLKRHLDNISSDADVKNHWGALDNALTQERLAGVKPFIEIRCFVDREDHNPPLDDAFSIQNHTSDLFSSELLPKCSSLSVTATWIVE